MWITDQTARRSVEEAPKHFCRRRKQTTVGALRVNKCEFSVYTLTIFMKYAPDNL